MPHHMHFLHLMQDLLELDPAACHALVESRVAVDPKALDHPTLVTYDAGDGVVRVGLLGVLNALLAVNGRRLVAEYTGPAGTPDRRLVAFHLDNLPPKPAAEA